ncbi:MAG TPA: GGDEF domain-containing protein [Burkholderiaceae bacterium]|nr:GGDEF domain-containing protein [Burkholderiaceae bacterium]
MQQASNRDVAPQTDAFSTTEDAVDYVSLKREPIALPRSATRPSKRLVDAMRRSKSRRRLLVGAGFSCLYLFALLVFSVFGAVDRTTLAVASVVVVIASQLFYVIYIRSKNQRQAEKKLTGPIATCALAIMLLVTYRAPDSRLIFTAFVFVAIAYGMYYLTRRAMLLLSAGTLTGFAAVIGLHHVQWHDAALLKSELLNWFVLALTLPGFVLLAGRVRQLHSALYKAGLKIRNIEEKARRDPMLGCYNRRFMVAVLEEQKRLADANGSPLCLAVIDLDHFKLVNDEVGHLAGDEVLRSFARVAQENIRQQDIFGRYGGEEFLLILPKTSLLAALNTAERIRDRVETNRWSAQLKAPVTVSIGLTQYNVGESVLDLFSRTDTAMYLAKRGGRNQVVVEEPHVELWQNATP